MVSLGRRPTKHQPFKAAEEQAQNALLGGSVVPLEKTKRLHVYPEVALKTNSFLDGSERMCKSETEGTAEQS